MSLALTMKIRTLLLVLLLFLVAIFAAANWPLFSQTSELNLLVRQVEAPFGIVMLSVVAVLTAIYLLFLGTSQAAAWLDSSRRTRELEEAQRVALSKEASRIHDLEQTVEQGISGLHKRLDELFAHFEKVEISEAVEQEGEEIEQRIGEAEKELRKDIKAARGGRSA